MTMRPGGLFLRLSSLTLTRVLLLWLAFLCVVATIVPQDPYPSLDGVSFPVRIIRLLSLRDVFHSVWFLGGAVLLAANLSACLFSRMSRRAASSLHKMPSDFQEAMLGQGGDPVKVSVSIRSALSGFGDTRLVEGSRVVVVSEKGSLRRLGPVIAHAGVFFVLLGSAFAFAGFKGTIEIPEGETRNVVTLMDGSSRRLGFSVTCERFSLERYPNGMPKEYRSEVVFTSQDGAIEKRRILVNHPAVYGGMLFSQSGYERRPIARITVRWPGGGAGFSAAEGDVIDLGDGIHKVRVGAVSEDMMRMGPGARLVVSAGEEARDLWLFGDIEGIASRYPGITRQVPQFDPAGVPPFVFSLDGVSWKVSTVLFVNRDPGVWFAGFGAVFFIAGVMLVFFVPHEQVWAVLEPEGGRLRLKVAMRRNGRAVEVPGELLERVTAAGGGR